MYLPLTPLVAVKVKVGGVGMDTVEVDEDVGADKEDFLMGDAVVGTAAAISLTSVRSKQAGKNSQSSTKELPKYLHPRNGS
jgi:hypothetical protein